MEWGRAKGYRIGPMVIVGKLRLQISDARQREGRPAGPDDGPAPSTVWEEHGHRDE